MAYIYSIANVVVQATMGNLIPTEKKLEFWHAREGELEKLHRSTATALVYTSSCEIEGTAANEDNGNFSRGVNFERYQINSVERFTHRNIFIDRFKGEELGMALVQNETPFNNYTKTFRLTLPPEKDVGKISVLDDCKNTLAVFYFKP